MLMEYTRESLLMESEKDTEHLNGTMEKCLKDSGKMERKMVLEYGDRLEVIFTKEIGCSIDNMEKVLSIIEQAPTEENLLIFSKMAMANSSSQMETNT